MDAKCMSCGKKLKGLVLYCDGCSGYICREDAVPLGEGQRFSCPNCTNEVQFFTL